MIRPLQVPLGVSPDYIPIDVREGRSKRNSVTVEKRAQKTNARDAAAILGLSYSTFMHKTKRNRAIRLLGKGDYLAGYERYEEILKKMETAFLEICEDLRTIPRGFTTLNAYMGERDKYTESLHADVVKAGVKQWKKLARIHRIVKQYTRLEALRKNHVLYLPMEKRIPLDKRFVKKYYWDEAMTTETIADLLVVPEIWVQKEVARLGMKKKENGIKPRGKRGFVMPEEQKEKHRNQPHAKAVVQICPETFKVLREYNATGAVERDGWRRENVRKAIRSAGLHDGFLWAYKGEEKSLINRAKEKGNLENKLKIWRNGSVNKEELYELYIVQDMNYEEVAQKLGCTPGAVACRASKFGFKKRKCISTEELRKMYIDQGMTARQIAEATGYPKGTISTYLCRRGISKMKEIV